jgi:hypothetical protein
MQGTIRMVRTPKTGRLWLVLEANKPGRKTPAEIKRVHIWNNPTSKSAARAMLAQAARDAGISELYDPVWDTVTPVG